jgi:hypothetical protein
MHPIMSDIDIAVRQFERSQEQASFQRQITTAAAARQNGVPSLPVRLLQAIHQFVDPRGFALRQYHLAHGRRTVVEHALEHSVPTAAELHSFPGVADEPAAMPAWRKAA